MLPLRRAVVVPVLLLIAACSTSPETSADDDASPSTAPSTTATEAGTTEPTTPVEPTSDGPDCAVEGPTTVPDGTWKGPVVLEIEATGEGKVVPSTSKGGQLIVTVKNGKVTEGRWDVRFTTKGDVSQQGQTAFLDVDVSIEGPVTGTGAKPVVGGSYNVRGSVTVDVAGEVPLDFSGPASETLEVVTTTCDDVTATFIPSLNSPGSPVTFSGLATWTGTRVS